MRLIFCTCILVYSKRVSEVDPSYQLLDSLAVIRLSLAFGLKSLCTLHSPRDLSFVLYCR